MNRLRERIQRANDEGRCALVIYLCVGDPSLQSSRELALAAIRGGADVLELGVPFSDPTADGPVIQRASERALRRGSSLKEVLRIGHEVRDAADVPLVLFTYYNPVLNYGEDRIVGALQASGFDGVLTVDLPTSDAHEIRERAALAGVSWIPLVAPTSDDSRVEQACKAADGFVYYVSVAGVTGAAHANLGGAAYSAREVEAKYGVPVALGFGVRTPADVADVAASGVSAVVVGSAVVTAIEKAENEAAAVRAVEDLVGALAKATSARGRSQSPT